VTDRGGKGLDPVGDPPQPQARQPRPTTDTRPAASPLHGQRRQERSRQCLVVTRSPHRQRNDLDRRRRPASHRRAHLHHEPATDPPAWSTTMHDLRNSRLVADPIDRYSIGDRIRYRQSAASSADRLRASGGCSFGQLGRSTESPIFPDREAKRVVVREKRAVPTGPASRRARLMSWRASLLIRLAVSPDHRGLAHRLGRFRSRRRLRDTRDGD
jgi:hypothetical protein